MLKFKIMENINNKKIKIAFFDAKPYDRRSFDQENIKFNYEFKYFNCRN